MNSKEIKPWYMKVNKNVLRDYIRLQDHIGTGWYIAYHPVQGVKVKLDVAYSTTDSLWKRIKLCLSLIKYILTNNE